MPLGEGWWISPDGKSYEVYEHHTFVKENPKLFDLPAELKKKTLSPTYTFDVKLREEVMRWVIERGWIRVRNGTYEAWELTQDVIFSIKMHLAVVSRGPSARIMVSEVSRNRWHQFTASEFETDTALAYARNPKQSVRRYSSHARWDDSREIHRLEKERGNVVDKVLLKPGYEAIWVGRSRKVAARYNRLAEEIEEDAPYTQEELAAVEQVNLTGASHVASMDDGEGGELWMRKRASK